MNTTLPDQTAHEAMAPTAPLAADSSEIVLGQLEEMLDALIVCQRDEQECILARDVVNLPKICTRIDELAVRLTEHQTELATHVQARALPEPQEKLRQICIKKFKRMQELAHQNHLLLENCLRFLQQIMGEFLGPKQKQGTYNQMGMLSGAFEQSGLLINLKI